MCQPIESATHSLMNKSQETTVFSEIDFDFRTKVIVDLKFDVLCR